MSHSMTTLALQELVRQVRTDTRRLLAAAQPTWLTWAPPGTSNHILWHAGHALWLGDVLAVQLLTGQSELPDEWAEMFGMNCSPVKARKTWPPRQEVDARLAEQLQRLLHLLENADEKKLWQPVRADRSDTVAGRIIHGLHDEAKHQGEMYLLLKMCRAQAQN
jgi:hypothetical protein